MARAKATLADDLLQIEPFAPANMHETIQARLMSFIRERALTPGDRLPSQSALAQALGVSTIALREAMRAMEALGIIEARAGSGWFVQDFSFDAAAKGLAYTFDLHGHNFVDLLEIRIRLECSYLPEVVPHLKPVDLAAMEQSVREMERLAEEGREFDAPDRAFHMQLFTGKVDNQFFVRVLELFWSLYPLISAPPERVQSELLTADARRHRLILEALQEGDVQLAVQRLADSLKGAVGRTSRMARPSAAGGGAVANAT